MQTRRNFYNFYYNYYTLSKSYDIMFIAVKCVNPVMTSVHDSMQL